ncbi:UDP-N-acetylglucosamine 2-epimerase (non-hydrolyzing) [bacterium]|nr:UDP-N-acetylglucosamine 2-epimerase (non-hydrolyzing) [candidate division CSSED10-310 bacterium]
MKIGCVVGARPNYMKIAPLLNALKKYPDIEIRLIHTGQHYDDSMSRAFFDDLDLPRPDDYLGVGSGSHAVQTAHVMTGFETVCLNRRFDRVVVAGDVNSTLACALAAAKLNIPVAHLEAGLRSFDRRMPEELNRILTDAVSDLLFVSEPSGMVNLRREGRVGPGVFLIGNIMIDTLSANLTRAISLDLHTRMGYETRKYGLLTMHRPDNVDTDADLSHLLAVLCEISLEIPLIYPVHPRAAFRVKRILNSSVVSAEHRIRVTDPLSYLDNLCLMAHARIVLTDSGGIQEETTHLNIPCLTLRPNTERPITVEKGTNTIVGKDPEKIRTAVRQVMNGTYKTGDPIDMWDGRTADRCARLIVTHTMAAM